MTKFEKSLAYSHNIVDNRLENNICFYYDRLVKAGFELDEIIKIICSLLTYDENQSLKHCAESIECEDESEKMRYLFKMMCGITKNLIFID